MAIPVLSADRYREQDRPAWFFRTLYPPGHHYPMHAHGFAEVCWIAQGRIRHRIGEDREETLESGDVRFIHPDTAHALAAPDRPGTVVNLSFPSAYLPILAGFADPLPFRAGEAPGFRLGLVARPAIDEWAGRLADPRLDRATVGAFLLWLIAEHRRGSREGGPGAPGWFNLALASFEAPHLLAQGVTALARLAGRSTGTVSRQVRRQHGCTAIQFINRRRIAWLAVQLRQTGTPIPDLAAACGLDNLGHCYRLFRQAHGCAPGEYRRKARGEAG